MNEKIDEKITAFYNKCDRFVQISELEFPEVKKLSETACLECERVNEILTVDTIRKYKMSYIRAIFVVLKRNMHVSKRKKFA